MITLWRLVYRSKVAGTDKAPNMGDNYQKLIDTEGTLHTAILGSKTCAVPLTSLIMYCSDHIDCLECADDTT
jgi:hypothetical protein